MDATSDKVISMRLKDGRTIFVSPEEIGIEIDNKPLQLELDKVEVILKGVDKRQQVAKSGNRKSRRRNAVLARRKK